ncbi:UDP-N-acetylmuramate dehydrogenase [Eggerthellaceae bacterium zg-1084]|uniref:UDP-N-acetylmuramate dehydrogenase n=1 Tax=Berryella wangjianweii TaxID=2734634 RepID=UPI0015529B78|nr:UDP-N-acetylmuramate dehydrogenase [Berryella wangjianweii]NPD31445.1 UDP-N-acetylmuramate dehydrogenase [Berryella wangjianweii]
MSPRHASGLDALALDEAFDGEVIPREPMARHTTYRIGGPARAFARVHSLGALNAVLDACAQDGVGWCVVGKGSNLLVADEGTPCAVIVLGRDFRSLEYSQDTGTIAVGAGHALSGVVQEAFRRSLGGLEFAVGTPGTVGGALRMNAGSSTDWIGSRVASVTTLQPGRGLRRYRGSDVAWGYRTSSFLPDEAIVECELMVERADPFYIRGKMEAALAKRGKTQPLTSLTCGSVFRNPEGHAAAQLIEACGLKGLRAGGAQVSPVHANFIVNEGGATASDVMRLITTIQAKVYEEHGIELQPEVRFLGFA